MKNYLDRKFDQLYDALYERLPDCRVCSFLRGLWAGIAIGAVLMWLV